MSQRINLLQNPIEQACGKMHTSASASKSNFAARVKGDSQLDTVDKLNEMNADLSSVLSAYHTMLLQHIEVTKKTVETLKETDIQLANQFKLPITK